MVRASALVVVAWGLFSGLALSAPVDPATPEGREIEQRIRDFYAAPFDDASHAASERLMAKPSPKYNVRTGQLAKPKLHMRWQGTDNTNPLAMLAQIKGSDEYDKFMCKYVYSKFPNLRCENGRPREGRATAEDDDQVKDLLDGFMATRDIRKSPADIPVDGETAIAPWSDDYWRLQWGGTAYRYSMFQRRPGESDEDFERRQLKTYRQFLASYKQPDELGMLNLGNLAAEGLRAASRTVTAWSPAEKYDLTVGDLEMSLTMEQRKSPEEDELLNEKGNVEPWMGICHGWAPAAFLVPRATRPVTVKGANNLDVTWYPHDIMAMSSLSWANGEVETNQVGGRCNEKKPKTFKNGRVRDQECFDTNPATFTLALANMIGILRHSFVMDKDFDSEVWNQPLKSYSLTYFNPLQPRVKTRDWNKDWEKVAVPYNAAFKAKDRFQTPLTRGIRRNKVWNDRGIAYVVGVIATVDYVEEVEPKWGNVAEADSVNRETYVYDLELHRQDGKLVAKGGEWHSNNHPDFLWLPRKNFVAYTDRDKTRHKFEGRATRELARVAARSSSNDGYPLCSVLKHLVDRASGTTTYTCKY